MKADQFIAGIATNFGVEAGEVARRILGGQEEISEEKARTVLVEATDEVLRSKDRVGNDHPFTSRASLDVLDPETT